MAYPGITNGLQTDPVRAVSVVKEKHLSLLYWNAVALGLAISVSKDDAAAIDRYVDTIRRAGRSSNLYFAEKTLGRSWATAALSASRSVTLAAVYASSSAVAPRAAAPLQSEVEAREELATDAALLAVAD